jgi:hypothetical protein
MMPQKTWDYYSIILKRHLVLCIFKEKQMAAHKEFDKVRRRQLAYPKRRDVGHS